MLSSLIIFSIVCFANSFLIIGFNRACQYEVYENDQHFVRDNKVCQINKGAIVEDSKMILWRVKWFCDQYIGHFWSKPIYSCCTCMASLHGLFPFLITASLTTGFSYMSILHCFFYMLTLGGFATIVNDRYGSLS